MNEIQKQVRADALIKLENIASDEIFWQGSVSASTEYGLDALGVLAPQAHESVQNGTCDEVSK